MALGSDQHYSHSFTHPTLGSITLVCTIGHITSEAFLFFLIPEELNVVPSYGVIIPREKPYLPCLPREPLVPSTRVPEGDHLHLGERQTWARIVKEPVKKSHHFFDPFDSPASAPLNPYSSLHFVKEVHYRTPSTNASQHLTLHASTP